jgi:hypothetical protein
VIYFCAQSNRRELVLQSSSLNGIDYLEVLGDPGCGKQLAVTFLKDARSLALTADNISLSGGTPVHVSAVEQATADDSRLVLVDLAATGDFSPYTLALVSGPDASTPPDGIDPQLASIEFSFKAGCPSPADCEPDTCCPATLLPAPDINYLAKDYPGFLQVMLDRMAVLTPGWTETHAADVGIAITEVLAYAADHLSYQQDALSTEAYIGTARSRISLRRHARLVDYTIGEGCNARTFVHVTAGADSQPIPPETRFYVQVPGLGPAFEEGDRGAQQLERGTGPVFQAMQAGTLYIDHNSIDFYTWNGSACCLPQGATTATLAKPLPMLQVGDVLIFEEVRGPETGQPEDADPSHRCAVCLTSVTPAVDPLNGDLPVTEITWAPADALPFPLCVSSTTDAAHGSAPIDGVSVARGNVIPADHGVWLDSPEALGTVPAAGPAPLSSAGCNCGQSSAGAASLPRFYPELAHSPLTFSVPFTGAGSATSFLSPGTAGARPSISLSDDHTNTWSPEPDLLGSGPEDRVFVPEIEFDGSVRLRFGDGRYGTAADPGVAFTASYRVGNGAVGNIGRDALAHAVLPAGYPALPNRIAAVRNPLPATSGLDPEGMEHIRRFAPFSYESQQRCVTEADYATITTQLTGGLAARGTLRWTGSWYTAFVSIDPTELTAGAVDETKSGLRKLRMMGTDVAVEAAVIVGLEIELRICVDPQHFQGDVFDALMRVFISGDQCDGRAGLLNAANFSFGQTVYASPLIAAAQAVEGVRSVSLVTFTRMDAPWVDGVAQGYLTMGRLDIPRCDNDPNHLDHGRFRLDLDGGK